MSPTFAKCLIVEKSDESPKLKIDHLPLDAMGVGDVCIDVQYSSLNYKDVLACQGHPGIIKSLPHVPGIDASGVVTQSTSPDFHAGQHVLVTGYELGQSHWGGWSQQIRVPSAWVVPLPSGLTTREAMIFGTAGFTAAQCALAFQQNEVHPQSGPILVTGSTGGVGSLAVKILATLGYEVVAVTGKSEQRDALISAGASQVIGREAAMDASNRPLLSAKWAGAVDTVGGKMLSSLLRQIKFAGCVCACGLVAGAELETTVYPFLLRGISLCGIASADCPHDKRLKIWDLLSQTWKPAKLDEMVTEVALDELPEYVSIMQQGKSIGKVLVRL